MTAFVTISGDLSPKPPESPNYVFFCFFPLLDPPFACSFRSGSLPHLLFSAGSAISSPIMFCLHESTSTLMVFSIPMWKIGQRSSKADTLPNCNGLASSFNDRLCFGHIKTVRCMSFIAVCMSFFGVFR